MGCGKAGFITCTICSATKYYSHVQRRFGTFSCEPCSKFMKRFLANPVPFRCLSDGNCKIGDPKGESEPRGVSISRCKSCWLKKCLDNFKIDQEIRNAIIQNQQQSLICQSDKIENQDSDQKSIHPILNVTSKDHFDDSSNLILSEHLEHCSKSISSNSVSSNSISSNNFSSNFITSNLKTKKSPTCVKYKVSKNRKRKVSKDNNQDKEQNFDDFEVLELKNGRKRKVSMSNHGLRPKWNGAKRGLSDFLREESKDNNLILDPISISNTLVIKIPDLDKDQNQEDVLSELPANSNSNFGAKRKKSDSLFSRQKFDFDFEEDNQNILNLCDLDDHYLFFEEILNTNSPFL